jgi:hypothetical protein
MIKNFISLQIPNPSIKQKDTLESHYTRRAHQFYKNYRISDRIISANNRHNIKHTLQSHESTFMDSTAYTRNQSNKFTIKLTPKYTSEHNPKQLSSGATSLNTLTIQPITMKALKPSPIKIRPSTAYKITPEQAIISKCSKFSFTRHISKLKSKRSLVSIEIKGTKVASKEANDSSINSKNVTVDIKKCIKEMDEKVDCIKRRSSLRRPSTTIKSSPKKLKTVCTSVTNKYLHPISMLLYKGMLRLHLERRPSYAWAPLIILTFDGVIGDYIKSSFFTPGYHFLLKTGYIIT